MRREGLQGRVLHGHGLVGAGDREAAAVVLEVVRGALELVRDDAPGLLDHLLGGVPERDAADRQAAAPVRVEAELHRRRVAVDHLDLVDRDAQPLGGDLREGRHVALPVRGGADEDLHAPGRQAADRGGVPAAGRVEDRAEDPGGREAAHLGVGREPDAELLGVPALPPLGLLAAEGLVVDHLERPVEGALEVAGVDLEAGRKRLRELLDEALAPDLDRVHVELARQRVHAALDEVGRLRDARRRDRRRSAWPS